MLWKERMAQNFYKHICKDSNFLYLNGKNVLQPEVSEIITGLLNEGKENYIELRNNLSQYKDIFRYIYSHVISEIYCLTERRGFNLKRTFHIISKLKRRKRTFIPKNDENVHNETCLWTKSNKNIWFKQSWEKTNKRTCWKKKNKLKRGCWKNIL